MICVSLANTDLLTCLHKAAEYPMVEIRLDLFHFDPEQIALIGQTSNPWIATCRPGKYNERERTVQLAASIRAGASWIDLEYESSPEFKKDLIELARKERCKVIISWHDFEKTPEVQLLDQLITDSRNMGADLVKIVPTVQTSRDAAKILGLYERYQNLIAFGMGEKGKITRIAAPLLGAPFTYASASDNKAIAPGQIAYHDLINIYSKL